MKYKVFITIIVIFLMISALFFSCENTVGHGSSRSENFNTLVKIEIVTLPAQLTYLLGEIPDLNGLVVKNIYTDGTELLTAEYDIQYDTFTAGTGTVTIISKEQSELTAGFDITVEKTLIDTGLPVIYIDTVNEQGITSREVYTKTNIKIVDPANPGNNLENTEYKDEIRGRGNTSWGQPKKPYRIKFDKKTSLFGYEKAKSWVLLANYQDPTLLMNTVAFELGARFGLPFTNHYQHVELVLNGTYQGSYVLTEQVQVGKGRVDIDEDDGFLVEFDVNYDEDPKFRTDVYQLPVMIKSPEDLSDPAGYDFVKDSINALEAALQAGSFPESGYRDLINMDTFVDFLLINEIVGNGELGWPKSTYLYKDKGAAKISMGPLWDFDWAFGYAGYASIYFVVTDYRNGSHSFFQRFFEDPVFCGEYKTHWNTHYGDVAGIVSFIDEMAAALEKSQALNARRWYPVDYHQEISKMKTWWTRRMVYLNTEINKY